MKTLSILILVFIGYTTTMAQDFTPSQDYFVALHGTIDQNNEEQLIATVYTKTDTPQEITFFPIANVDMIDSIAINVLEDPNLNGVKQVLKVDVNYKEYCTYKVSNYVLETDKGGFISLPMLTNEDCGDSNNAMVYLFPSQQFGKENQILTSEVTFTQSAITEASQEDSFIWNDDDFGTSGTLYQDF